MDNMTVILGHIAYDQGASRMQKREIYVCRQYITATCEIKEVTCMVFGLKRKLNKQYFSPILPTFQIEI